MLRTTEGCVSNPSALLMASQCVSISLEILTHLVQPELVQHPLLSIVVGGTSLILNILVLAWRRSRSRGIDEAADGISKSLMRNDPHSTSERKVSQCAPGRSGFRRQQLGSIGVIQHLLGSVLVLTNGLVLLLSAAHCHRPHSDCHLLVYLDTGFSAVCAGFVLHGPAEAAALRAAGAAGDAAASLRGSGAAEAHWSPRCAVGAPAACVAAVGGAAGGLAASSLSGWAERRAVCRSDGEDHRHQTLHRAAGVHPERCCGQECVEKLCCSPQGEETSCPKTESPVCVQEEESCSPAPHSDDQIRDVVIENMYL